MTRLLAILMLGLACWALRLPYGICVAVVLGACAVALFMERPKGLRRHYDNRLGGRR